MSPCSPAACDGTGPSPWGLARRNSSRCRGRVAPAGARDRGAGGADRGRARPALPPHRAKGGQRHVDRDLQDRILSVSLGHGFPWGDTPEVETRVLVVADGDRAVAAALAARLGAEVWSMRAEISPPFLSIEAAVDRIMGHDGEKPLVLADAADNPGIGAAGDSTFLLARLIERGLDIGKCRGLIVKSTQHFHAGFLPVAAEILYVSAPGTGAMDMRALPFKRVSRALWPRVAEPHAD